MTDPPLHPGFHDYFSADSSAYAEFRPSYPDVLFEYLALLCPHRDQAWDAGTGSGQAAVALARHFESVIATDASPSQLAHAEPHPRVLYRVAAVGASGVPTSSVDLVTVAQALHWFDHARFWEEVLAVLAPQGVIAAWCYGLMRIEPAVDEVVTKFYRDRLGPWWPPERRLVDEGYRSIDFPFREITPPSFTLERVWTLRELTGYLGTWSAVRRFRDQTGEDPVASILPDLSTAWGAADRRRPVSWPISMRVGRRPDRWRKR